MSRQGKILIAEIVGTFVLVLGGCGSAVLAGDKIGFLGVSCAFGLSLLVMAYAIGGISGCHVNPVVTLSLAAANKLEKSLVPVYVVAQIVGGILGGAILFLIASGKSGFDISAGFATNGYGIHSPGGYSLLACAIAEIVLTFFLVFTVLCTTHREFPVGFGGVAVGMVLFLIHLVGIPVTNTSVNPARSLGVAVFQGGWALSELWLFIVAPIVGGLIAVAIYKAMDTRESAQVRTPVSPL
jgi:aquaporin Z